MTMKEMRRFLPQTSVNVMSLNHHHNYVSTNPGLKIYQEILHWMSPLDCSLAFWAILLVQSEKFQSYKGQFRDLTTSPVQEFQAHTVFGMNNSVVTWNFSDWTHNTAWPTYEGNQNFLGMICNTLLYSSKKCLKELASIVASFTGHCLFTCSSDLVLLLMSFQIR